MELNSKSPIAGKLLNDYYKSLDIDWIKNNEIYNEMVESEFKYNFGIIRKKFLDKFKKDNGLLFCQICGEKNLVITYKGNKQNDVQLATVEHFIPISEGGMKYNTINFLCTCSKCNNKRGVKPLYKISDKYYKFEL